MRGAAGRKSAAPLAVITFAIPLASATSLIGGGLLAENLGWRMAFVVMGAFSVVFAPLVLLIVGTRQSLPVAVHRDQDVTVKWWALLRKRSFLAVIGGTALVSAAGYSLTTFSPAFLMRTRSMSLSEVGWEYGLATGLGGVLGLLIVGRLADRLAVRDARWLLWIVVATTALLLPASVLAFTVESRLACVWFLALSYIIGTAYLAPSIAAIHRLVLPGQRATASAIFLFFNATLGSFGPFVTGLISDALTADLGAQALGRALLILVPALQLMAMGCYLIAARWYRADIIETAT